MHQPGHSGRGEHSGGNGFGARRSQTAGDAFGDVRAGFARITPDQDARRLRGRTRMRTDVFAERQADAVERGVVQGHFAGHAANAVGSEKLFGHGIGKSRQKIRHVILSLPLWRSRAAAESTSERITFAQRDGRASVRGGTALFAGRGLCYRSAMPLEEAKIASSSSASGKIIAAGIVIAFCYWASSILVTLLVAVLLAYFLDPVVNWLEGLARAARAGFAAGGSVHDRGSAGSWHGA